MDEARTHSRLIRTVGLAGLVMMCINAVVGSGIFLLPSDTFRLLGPFSLWAPLLFAVPVFILVLCFAEAASAFSAPGGAFLYARTAFGDFVGFETGWMNWLARVTSLAALANGFVISLARLFPSLGRGTPRVIMLVGPLVLLAAIHIWGVRYGAATIYGLTIGKLAPLVVFVIVAIAVHPHNPLPASTSLPPPGTDWSSAALLLLFAYAGFENLGVPAGEYRNPGRDLPFALLLGTVAIALVYALTQWAALAAMPNLGATNTPIADAAAAIMGGWGALLVSVGAAVSILGTNSGTMLEGSRMLYAISIGRRRYRAVSAVHSRFHTPWIAIVIHTGIAIPLALKGSFVTLAMLSTVARMTTYLVTAAAVPRLRPRSKGFRTPGWIVPALGTLIALTLFLTLHMGNLVAAIVALAVGALLWAFGDSSVEEIDRSLALEEE